MRELRKTERDRADEGQKEDERKGRKERESKKERDLKGGGKGRREKGGNNGFQNRDLWKISGLNNYMYYLYSDYVLDCNESEDIM